MTRPDRLSSSREFRRVLEQGARAGSSTLSVCLIPGDRTRVGVSASKRIGGAVARNRAKRLLREAVRAVHIEHADVVITARPAIVGRSFHVVLGDLKLALDRLPA